MVRWIACLLCLLLSAGAVEAKKKDKDKDKGHKGKDAVVDVNVDVDLGFSVHQREWVRKVFVEKHGRGHCPPGLAKKGNGCLPPGQAKKRYAVGRPLAASIRLDPVPEEFRVRLGDPPKGYRYGVVDGDLVKLAVGTALVVDAIDSLVD